MINDGWINCNGIEGRILNNDLKYQYAFSLLKD
jgi:hypothetical protein